MNSRDILDEFLADGTFSSACTREKFARECSSSMSPEISAKIYDLILEQHEITARKVKHNVYSEEFLQGISDTERQSNGSHLASQESPSISHLISCLSKAIKTSESHSVVLDEQISEQLEKLKKKKEILFTLIPSATDIELLPLANSNELAEKCIDLLQK